MAPASVDVGFRDSEPSMNVSAKAQKCESVSVSKSLVRTQHGDESNGDAALETMKFSFKS